MYIKRIIVLKGESAVFDKQAALAIKAETDLTLNKLRINFVNFTEELIGGVLFLFDGERCQSINIESKTLFFDLHAKSGLSALIFGKNGETLYYGASGQNTLEREKLIKMHADCFDNDFGFDKDIYDDEKIAEFDFYNERRGDALNGKSEADYERDAKAENGTQKFGQKKASEKKASENEYYSKSFKSEEPPFFAAAKAELEAVFSRGTRETALERVVSNSKWVKICYSRDNYYVVGIVERDGAPKYICYGVPGRFGAPPEKLKGAAFIPESLFAPQRNGYYVLFQSAVSGGEIRLDSFYSIN